MIANTTQNYNSSLVFDMDASECDRKSEKKPDLSSFPLSDYAKKLELLVTQRYLEKISVIGIDPALIEGKHFLKRTACLRWSPQICYRLFYYCTKCVLTVQFRFSCFGVEKQGTCWTPLLMFLCNTVITAENHLDTTLHKFTWHV